MSFLSLPAGGFDRDPVPRATQRWLHRALTPVLITGPQDEPQQLKATSLEVTLDKDSHTLHTHSAFYPRSAKSQARS